MSKDNPHLRSYIEHSSPGRLRLRFRSRRGDVDFFKYVVAAISKFPEIEAIDAFPKTGSVLIRHSLGPEDLESLTEDVAAWIDEEPLPPLSKTNEADTSIPTLAGLGLQTLSLLQLLRGRHLGTTSEHLWQALQAKEQNIQGVAPFLVALALVQLLRGNILSPASSLFMYSLVLQKQQSRGEVRRAVGRKLPLVRVKMLGVQARPLHDSA